MKIEFLEEIKPSVTRHRGEPARFCIELSRTEAMKLIAGLSASLIPFNVTRYSIQYGTHAPVRLPISFLNIKDFFAEAVIFVNYKDGYLCGDTLPNQDD